MLLGTTKLMAKLKNGMKKNKFKQDLEPSLMES